MRLATRITLTMSLLVVLTLGIFGWVTQRNQRSDRLEAIGRDANILAAALRTSLDVTHFSELDLSARDADLTKGLERAGLPWRVRLLDARDAPPPDAPPTGNPSRDRLGKLMALRTAVVDENARDHGKRAYVYVEQGPNAWTIKVSPLTGKTEVVDELEEIPR